MKTELPTYDSVKACHGATGIPVSIIMRAKKAGCTAFKSNRVYLGPLLRWIFEKGISDLDAVDWSRELRKEQALRQRIARKKDENQAVDLDTEVRPACNALMSFLFVDLERFFLNDLPPMAKGLDELSIRALSKKYIEQLRAQILEKLAAIRKEEQEKKRPE